MFAFYTSKIFALLYCKYIRISVKGLKKFQCLHGHAFYDSVRRVWPGIQTRHRRHTCTLPLYTHIHVSQT